MRVRSRRGTSRFPRAHRDLPVAPRAPPPATRPWRVRFRRDATAVLAALTLGLATSCKEEPPRRTPEEVAYEFRDVMPYPGITEGSEAESLAPLVSPYLVYIQGNDFPRAAAEFGAVAKAHPDMAEARLLQGIALVLAERPQDAIEPLESVVKASPRNAPARWWLAKALFQTGLRDQALIHVREVAAANGPYEREASRVLAAVDANP
jgi:Flp pilus assembly protein TadD